jgi:hypothetical protein
MSVACVDQRPSVVVASVEEGANHLLKRDTAVAVVMGM